MTDLHVAPPVPSQRTGQMTAMMRAVMPAGPRVLRVGLVRAGRVIAERVLRVRDHVTVGTSEKAQFVVASRAMPPVFRLFEVVGDAYHLNVLEGMTGRVVSASGTADLADLRRQVRRTRSGAYPVPLGEDSRGKVAIGDVTFLFQFVANAPPQPRPQLPASLTRGASGLDWPTTVIAAMSFLLHFMAIGAVYSDWLDPVVDDELVVASLVDSVAALPAPPTVEEPDVEAPVDADTGREKAAAPTPAAAKNPGRGAPAGPMSAVQAAALTNELAQLEMETLGALAGTGPATAGVLSGGEVPTGALDLAAASGAGVGIGGFGDLRLGGGGGPMRPGSAGMALGGIGVSGQTEGTSGSGKRQEVKGPVGNASVGGVSGSGNVSDASRVVAGMRATFRACYQRELAANPDAEGSIRLTLRIGPGGEVQGVSAASTGNLGSAVGCVQARAAAAQFAPPEGGSASITVPVTFVKQ